MILEKHNNMPRNKNKTWTRPFMTQAQHITECILQIAQKSFCALSLIKPLTDLGLLLVVMKGCCQITVVAAVMGHFNLPSSCEQQQCVTQRQTSSVYFLLPREVPNSLDISSQSSRYIYSGNDNTRMSGPSCIFQFEKSKQQDPPYGLHPCSSGAVCSIFSFHCVCCAFMSVHLQYTFCFTTIRLITHTLHIHFANKLSEPCPFIACTTQGVMQQ